MTFPRSNSGQIAVARHAVNCCTRRMLAACGMVTLTLCAGIATAQTGTWTAPSSGYFYDSTNRSILSLTGFIGSAMRGPSVASGIDWVSVAPNQKSALAQQNGLQIWIPDLSAAATFQVLDRIPLALQAFWAADSSQAAILTAGGELIWLTNFSSGPVPVSTWNLKSYGPAVSGYSGEGAAVRRGAPRTLAVWSLLASDSHANQVLLAVHVGETWQIWFASSTVPPQNIPFSGRPAAAVFSPGAGGIFVADANGHRVVHIENPDTIPVVASVISEGYVNELAALAVSSDGKRLFVADHSGSVIRVFDLGAIGTDGSSPIAELPTGAAPVSFTAFSQDRYIVNTGGSAAQPIFFLNTGVPSNMSFVPGKQ